jgi:hypothetical protein
MPRRSSTTLVDLLSQDVGMASVLCKLAKDLQLKCPDRARTSPLDDRVAPQSGEVPPRGLPAFPIRRLNRRDRVALAQRERALDGRRDADLPIRPTGDRLVEPHALDEARVLDEAEQRRLRGYEPTTCLLLGQIIERAMKGHSVLVDQFVDSLALVGGPVSAALLRHRITL